MKRLAPAFAAIIAIGCGRAPVGRAYLNLERVAQGDPLFLSYADPPPRAPAATRAESLSIPPLVERTLDFSENKSRLVKVQQAVDEAREQSARQIAAKLREAYLREIDVVETEKLLDLNKGRPEIFDRAWRRVRERFLTHAHDRAPHAIRLALYAGFPDPDPQSSRPPVGDQTAFQRRFERAKNARASLTALDRTYEADVDKLLAAYDAEVATALRRAQEAIEQMRIEAEARAIKEAADQVAQLTAQLESVLSGKSEVKMPGRPGKSVSVPAGSAPPPFPTLELPTRKEAETNRMDAVRSDAEIWAAHFGVTLVKTPSQGPDRTDEFIQWRKQRQSGP